MAKLGFFQSLRNRAAARLAALRFNPSRVEEPQSYGHISWTREDAKSITAATCPDCGKRTRLLSFFQEWYGWRDTVLALRAFVGGRRMAPVAVRERLTTEADSLSQEALAPLTRRRGHSPGYSRMTRAARFTSADISRAVRAAEKCGLSVAGYEIGPDGTIRILTASPRAANDGPNPLDRLHG